MDQTKDVLRGTIPSVEKVDNIIGRLDTSFPTLTHVGVAVINNTIADTVTAGVGDFNIEPWDLKARFMDEIHSRGLSVLDRATDAWFEGLYDFGKQVKRNGNRHTYFGTPITDNFDSDASRDHGYGLTSAAGNISTNYTTAVTSGNTWTISGDELTGPAASGWARAIYFNTTTRRLRDVTATALIKKVGNQQLAVRATTDTNFPGYGCQIRSTNTVRLERPGITSLGQVTKTLTEGNYYWVKIQAIGSAIKCKAWAAASGTEDYETGQNNEPATWDIEATDIIYTNENVTGLVGFAGETSTGKFAYLRIDPEVDTNTWIYKYFNSVVAHIDLYRSGDILAPYPEAMSHFSPYGDQFKQQGTYSQFFQDVAYIADRVGDENGLALRGDMVGHNFTDIIQGANVPFSMSTALGYCAFDHYGSVKGLIDNDINQAPTSWPGNTTISGSDTYTVPTSITESATHREDFIPDKAHYNTRVRVYVVSKGTGDLTMTIHGPDGNPVRKYDNEDISSSSLSYQATIANASINENAYNYFPILWNNLNSDQTHHFHLTSTGGDATVRVLSGNSGNLNAVVNRGYKDITTAESLEFDIRNAYLKTGVPCFWQEFGDHYSLDSVAPDIEAFPARTKTQHQEHLRSIFAAAQRLVNDDILIGFNWWRGGNKNLETDLAINEPYESIIYDSDAGAGFNYVLNYQGEELKTFFDANGDIEEPPVVTTERPKYQIAPGTGKVNITSGRYQFN